MLFSPPMRLPSPEYGLGIENVEDVLGAGLSPHAPLTVQALAGKQTVVKYLATRDHGVVSLLKQSATGD